MRSTEQDQQKLFENEARRIARELWPASEYGGAEMVDGKERDGIFDAEDCIHLLEATVSKSLNKAQNDFKKLSKLAKSLQAQNPQKAVKCWFVTREEPTADQRTECKQYGHMITPISFSQFQSKLVNVSSYLDLREKYAFGSIRDPATGTSKGNIEYIPLDLVEANDGAALWTLSSIKNGLLKGDRFALFGDYGAGKSMTMREVYKDLRSTYYKQRTPLFPIYINLRDHFGQTSPAEVLERHARNIGFLHPSHLVRAWRAGYVILFIDGFDEIATLGIQGVWKRLQQLRYRAMESVRRFIVEQPANAGLLLAGRAHFFDSDKERREALGMRSNFTELNLNEFNDEQIHRYLEKWKIAGTVPDWLPSRPLLVGYLATSGILQQAFSTPNNAEDAGLTMDPAKGWNMLLDRICEREAEIEAGIDGGTVRRILERLATIARQSLSGVGPLSQEQIAAAFYETCDYVPDEKGLTLLQRLPGLGIYRAEEGTRIFLDQDLADVCRVGDTARFIDDPFGTPQNLFRNSECGLGTLGIGLLAIKAQEIKVTSGKLVPVLRKAAETDDLSILLVDVVKIALELGCSIDVSLRIRDTYIPAIELTAGMADCSRLAFDGCFFSNVMLDPELDESNLPRFHECFIDELEGRSSKKDLPKGIFDENCEIDRYSESSATTNAIEDMELPLGTRVLLTILRKIYVQRGSGRKENALQRGLDHHGRRLVSDILRLLETEGIISRYRRGGMEMSIWVPNRSTTVRVGKLISSPRTCGDSLIEKISRLS